MTDILPELLRGHDHLERTERGIRPHRLPSWVGSQCPDPRLLQMEEQPSGVRLVMVTRARQVELTLHPARLGYGGFQRPRGSVDLVVDGELVDSAPLTGGDLIEMDLATGEITATSGPAHVARFAGMDATDKVVELWLPHNESVELVELHADAPVTPAAPTARRWLHYGSSISQGSNAATPARTWPALAARSAGVDLRNLGLGGSAFVDPFVARVMASSPADLISLKIGINIVNADAMRLRTFVPIVHGFLDTIRDGHPDTPVLLASPTFCEIHEDTPGPGAFDPEAFTTGQVRFAAAGETGDVALGRLTLAVIRDALAELVETREDPNLHYLDGTTLYGERDAHEHPLEDALHPDTVTHELIGTRFARYAFGDGGPFAA